ncbi:phage major capsid protein [Janthinobacterium sp. SUN073]|uniref:phage major capsid protein n=1 Tax=Janthinobacterium sp. SUN073 TaxID=3004102 RepID=UPI0025B1B416|nr:phage major capsid protein [Janthinobacterium sp. SUN073]MDN2699263.1 phage major capsid protein [Janthinobacterium sp. SUN073]
MKSIQALREQRQSLAKEARNQLANKGDRAWTKDDQVAFDARADQIEALESEITATERVMQMEIEDHNRDVEQFRTNPAARVENNKSRELFAKLLREGPQNMTREEVTEIRNTMSTGTGSQGGYTVQSDVAKQLIDALKSFGGMRGVASSITTSQGNPLSYPTSDGTSEEGEWVPENTQASSADPTFGTVGLGAFKASSKIITIPMELLQDSSIDIIAMVTKRINDRIGRTMNKGFSTGSGVGQPFGFASVAGVGKIGASGQTATVTVDDLIDLQESIDQAYQDTGTCRFMMHQQTRKGVRKLKDSSGRPIWAESYEAGIKTGTPAQLLGSDVVINNDMAQPAANAKTIGFGDFSKYMIRDVLEMLLFRFEDSIYTSKGQVGFLAWARAGGNLLDLNGIKLYQQSAA